MFLKCEFHANFTYSTCKELHKIFGFSLKLAAKSQSEVAVCGCGTPWTFLLPFFFNSKQFDLKLEMRSLPCTTPRTESQTGHSSWACDLANSKLQVSFTDLTDYTHSKFNKNLGSSKSVGLIRKRVSIPVCSIQSFGVKFKQIFFFTSKQYIQSKESSSFISCMQYKQRCFELNPKVDTSWGNCALNNDLGLDTNLAVKASTYIHLTLSSLQTNTDTFANSADPNEKACNEFWFQPIFATMDVPKFIDRILSKTQGWKC